MRSFDYNSLEDRLWDTEILTLVSKIHEYKGRGSLYSQQRHSVLDRFVKTASMQSIESSNRIEGIVTSRFRLKQLLEEKSIPKERDEEEIMGYRDVLNTINESYEYIPISPSYILRLHRDLLKRAGNSYAGKFKSVQNYIVETRSDKSVVTRFIPLSPYETPIAVEDLCNAYNIALTNEKIEPLILIFIFVFDFLCIHPFNDGNERMSRLLTNLLLYKRGYTIGKYVSIEKEIENTKGLYYKALKESQIGWLENKNDPMPFVKYMLKVILSCYIELEDCLESTFSRERTSSYDIVKRYTENKIGKFTGSEVISNCPSIGRSSALSALKRLTEEGIIKRIGSGKSTFYVHSDSE